jgi:N-methylhydantoinase A/oxoprolinase/acetone carboxylase beta subunit
MDAATAERFPVLTFASGPTNSMRGAAFLSGEPEAIVLDIGGTTTDVGLLHKGFPRQASTTVDVGGVRTNFRMPDVFSIGLGGGSLVKDAVPEPEGGPGTVGRDISSRAPVEGVPRSVGYETTRRAPVEVGPRSVGYEITRRARVFGGDTLTATDIAVAAGRADIGERGRVSDLDADLVRRALEAIESKLSAALDRARTSPEPMPVIAVGGGSILMPDTLCGLPVVRPSYFGAANAIGAAIAQTSGEVDRIYSLDAMTRGAALADAESEARRKATAAGARADTLVVTEREDVPLAYLRGNATRVRVKVVGEMATPGGSCAT